MFKSFIFVCLISFITYCQSSNITTPGFSFGKPVYFGSGCPSGTVKVVSSSNGDVVSVLFSQYQAETYGNHKRHRISCNLAVPVDIDPGLSVGIYKIDYRGNAYVPYNTGSYGKFDADYFFGGYYGAKVSRTYQRGTDSDFLITDNVATVVWSPCGKSTTFRVNTALTAKKKSAYDDDVQMTIDTTDSSITGFQYFIKTQSC